MKDKSVTIALEKVKDERSFLEFIEALYKDKEKNAHEWRNDTIDSFLESSFVWGVESIDGLQFYKKSENPWKRCADIIYMGKIYE